jgi:hypothetical protein
MMWMTESADFADVAPKEDTDLQITNYWMASGRKSQEKKTWKIRTQISFSKAMTPVAAKVTMQRKSEEFLNFLLRRFTYKEKEK